MSNSPDPLSDVAGALDAVPYTQRRALRKKLRALKRRAAAHRPIDRGLRDLRRQVEQGAEMVARRRDLSLRLEFPAGLPVSAHVQTLRSTLDEHPVMIVCGETGSGKSTQLPKICLEAGRGIFGVIAHTQPRRVAARAVAARLAEETATRPGEAIGYRIRFDEQSGPHCRVRVMTDGILLAELARDRLLLDYDTIIVDEAHERSLNIDFLLGYLKTLLARRPELKVIVTSATIDADALSRHFDGAPVIEVSGRGYPVEIRYRPIDAVDTPAAVVASVDELAADGPPGDTLVFLAGEREIRETHAALRKRVPAGTQILPLYARLSAAEQDRVFAPHDARRIVLATNVAETSLTVPGITSVVDPGTARISRYGYRSKIQRLQIEPVSQASASQRAGRCGRVAPGVCIRLYGEDDFDARPAFMDPEILRTNLASVILNMAHLDLGDIERFAFVDPPDRRFINDGYRLLGELEAVDAERRVTTLGHRLASLPVDPRVGRIVLEAARHDCLTEALVIAAALSIPDPRERPHDRQQAADAAHAAFADPKSDFVALLNLWRAFTAAAGARPGAKLKAWCRRRFLSYPRMREWQDIRRQLAVAARRLGLERNREPASYAAVHRAILAGFIGHIGQHDENGNYRGARNTRFRIGPGSGLAGRTPRWVVAATLRQTTRLYARTVAVVQPAWIEAAAAHLVNRNRYDPYWAAKPGCVMAFERVGLYGLELFSRRRVRFGAEDPVLARSLFLREGLAAGRHAACGRWRSHNERLLGELRAAEAKLRRRGTLVDDRAVEAFYAAAVPDDIDSIDAFEGWRRRAERNDPKVLHMTLDDLGVTADRLPPVGDFPDHYPLDGNRLSLAYRFEPGDPADGVTLTIPAPLVPQLRGELTEWLVPGMLVEKVATILRGLPKPVRRHFVPTPDYARRFADAMRDRNAVESLYVSLANFMNRDSERTGVTVDPRQLRAVALPDHLQMNLRVVDEQNRVVDEGRAPTTLTDGAGTALPAADDRERTGLRSWQFDALPESVTLEQNRLTLVRYPALVDRGDRVDLRLLDSPAAAAAQTAEALVTLITLALPQQARFVRRRLLPRNESALLAHGLGDVTTLVDDLLRAAIRRVFVLDPLPRDRTAFERIVDEGRAQLVPAATELAELCTSILTRRRVLVGALDAPVLPDDLRADVRRQLDALVFPGFVAATPASRFADLPRYLDAAHRRVERVRTGSGGRDRQQMAQLEPFLARYQAAHDTGARNDALERFRWLLEEFRVSLFAQHLGTSEPVSAVRLERAWDEVAAALPTPPGS